MATIGAILSVLLWLVVAGLALAGFMLLRAAGFAVIQRHGAVTIKFLVVWIVGWFVLGLRVAGITTPETRGAGGNSVGVAGGFILAAAACFLTARRTA